jgi:hypothetical protein
MNEKQASVTARIAELSSLPTPTPVLRRCAESALRAGLPVPTRESSLSPA